LEDNERRMMKEREVDSKKKLPGLAWLSERESFFSKRGKGGRSNDPRRGLLVGFKKSSCRFRAKYYDRWGLLEYEFSAARRTFKEMGHVLSEGYQFSSLGKKTMVVR